MGKANSRKREPSASEVAAKHESVYSRIVSDGMDVELARQNDERLIREAKERASQRQTEEQTSNDDQGCNPARNTGIELRKEYRTR